MLKNLCDFLDSHKTRYTTVHHSQAFTAQEIAESAHVQSRDFAKTVIVKLDGKLAMVVLPASEKVDTDLLGSVSGSKKAEIAGENEFQSHFPKCEIGAMPPFGNLFEMDVYVEEKMAANDNVVFNAGTHTELVQMSMKDFLDLIHPKIVRISKSNVC